MKQHALKAAAIAAAVLAIGATLINQLTPHASGTPSSSYATSADGLAGYADLLVKSGHPVTRLRATPDDAELDPRGTIVLLDPGVVLARDVRALRAFVLAGGRLIAGGREPGAWLTELLAGAPDWSSPPSQSADTILPTPETSGVRSVHSDGTGRFSDAGSTLPVIGDARSALVTVVNLGAGRLVLLADASPLQNHLLAQADNAALGLAIAGPAPRRVSFEEAVHGYGQRRGLAALPVRWKWALAGLVLAALLTVAARFRRLGPAEPTAEPRQPPRRAHVDALASALARTGTPDAALRPVQEQARMILLSRAHLTATAREPDILTAAERFGLDAAEARAILAPGLSEADAVAAGRALAKLEGSAT